MPYGLVNAPSVLQGYMNEVFREYLHRFVLVYIDYIFVYSQNEAEHRLHIPEVLQELQEYSWCSRSCCSTSQLLEVHVTPGFNPVPRVSVQLPRYQDGRGEGWSYQDLAHTHYYQITPAIPRFFKFPHTLNLQFHHWPTSWKTSPSLCPGRPKPPLRWRPSKRFLRRLHSWSILTHRSPS